MSRPLAAPRRPRTVLAANAPHGRGDLPDSDDAVQRASGAGLGSILLAGSGDRLGHHGFLSVLVGVLAGWPRPAGCAGYGVTLGLMAQVAADSGMHRGLLGTALQALSSEDAADRHLAPVSGFALPMAVPREPVAPVAQGIYGGAPLSLRPYGPHSRGYARWPEWARLTPARRVCPGFLECSREEKLTGYNMTMLFMVIEHYTHGPEPVYQRAAGRGRMLPDGLRYVDSWIVDDGRLERCFQLMETGDPELLDVWRGRWADLCDFEVFPVIKSDEAARRTGVRGTPGQ